MTLLGYDVEYKDFYYGKYTPTPMFPMELYFLEF